MQFGTLPDFRPIPNVYNSSHQYYFYLIGDGDPIVFRANDCCLGDNSGQFQFVLSEVIINDQCKLNYTWSNSTTGNSATLTPSNTPYIISLKKGSSICSVDTFYVTAQSSIDSQPQNQNAFISNSALFAIASSDPLATYQWQTDLGAGFQNLNSVGQYSGTNTDTLTVSNVSMSNNNQPFRCIINSGSCSDTSNVAVLTVKNNLVITTPPLNHSKCEGDTAYFTCSVTGTFDSLQWQQYSSGWSRIKGGLDTFYRIDSTAALMNGDSIRVIAYGPGGNDTSGAAVIQLRGFKPKVATNAITQPTSGQANGSVDLTISGYGSYLRYSRWTSKPGNNYPNAGDFDLSNAAEGIYYLMIVTKQGCVYYEGPFNLGPSR